MRSQAIAEVGGSALIAILTGSCAFGGLILGVYALLALPPAMKLLGLIVLLFGVENLPISILWTRQTIKEGAIWADSLPAGTRRASMPH